MKKRSHNRSLPIDAKKSIIKQPISYEMKLTARFVLDEICFEANIAYLKEQIDVALDQGDREAFYTYSSLYKQYYS